MTIPDSVTSIGEQAFREASGLASVVIGSGVTSIGNYAFAGTAITLVTIPASVTSIGNHAFQGTGLTSVTIPASVVSIDYQAFGSISTLTSVTMYSSSSLSCDANRWGFSCAIITYI